jgi:hypothetical protein
MSLWAKRKIITNEGYFGPTSTTPHPKPSNRPSFASLPHDLHDDSCAPPAVAPSPILKQNWETLAPLAS